MKILSRIGYLLAYWEHRKVLERDEIARRNIWMKAVAHNAAKEAVQHYVSWRSLDWWKKQIEEAEKRQEKYMALADFITTIKEENSTQKEQHGQQ